MTANGRWDLIRRLKVNKATCFDLLGYLHANRSNIRHRREILENDKSILSDRYSCLHMSTVPVTTVDASRRLIPALIQKIFLPPGKVNYNKSLQTAEITVRTIYTACRQHHF